MLGDAPLGRSHRAAIGKAKLAEAIDLTREILAVPADYRIGIVPASDTGAVEMALWSLLGARPVEMLAWESFGEGWVTDVVKQLKLEAKVKIAPYGQIVDFTTVDFDSDLVFTWNGTTSGCRLPNGDAIPATRAGLTICDATSAAFAMDLPWDKLDVTILREGKSKSFQVTLRNREGNTDVLKKEDVVALQTLGASFETLTQEDKGKYGLRSGVKITDVGTGKIAQAGVPKGFILVKLNNSPVGSQEDVERILGSLQPGDGVLLQGYRPDGRPDYYAFGY